ncbi:MAG TPA: SDR family NAD(P)-dependent oxidoreductase [Actinomycetota bacterium]|jgi:NADP-dependent 3-hydroxy acid dehydrogenase YdfG|nr:SDR family NAD(P)-dependent oxidoreductase [Actinomycetota bacterium]
MNEQRVAVVTGASAGIGAETARRLASEGFRVILGARRLERIEEIAATTGGVALPLDVRDARSVQSFCEGIESCDVLVNNAGRASGLQEVAELEDERTVAMWETNVLGLLRVTRPLIPKLIASGRGHIVNVGSTAGIEAYPGGAGYTMTKHAVRVLTRTLRLELLGKPVRVTEVAPGLVKTEFSLVRFDGDEEAAERPYRGMTPLTAEDVADCIAWAVTRPPHVNIDEIIVRPLAQASSTLIARDQDD